MFFPLGPLDQIEISEGCSRIERLNLYIAHMQHPHIAPPFSKSDAIRVLKSKMIKRAVLFLKPRLSSAKTWIQAFGLFRYAREKKIFWIIEKFWLVRHINICTQYIGWRPQKSAVLLSSLPNLMIASPISWYQMEKQTKLGKSGGNPIMGVVSDDDTEHAVMIDKTCFFMEGYESL